jgi:CRP-like cAMP-binding protein
MADDWLIPLMSHEKYPAGHVLFRAGDPANRMYLVLSGTVRLAELGITVESGHLLGEMGVFSPDNRRTATAISETNVELGAISDQKVLQLYYQNPEFGFYLLRLILKRLLENERLRSGGGPAGRR